MFIVLSMMAPKRIALRAIIERYKNNTETHTNGNSINADKWGAQMKAITEMGIRRNNISQYICIGMKVKALTSKRDC